MVLLLLVAGAAVAQQTMGPAVAKRPVVRVPRLEVIQGTRPELIVADLDGDGIDLSGVVRTSLVTGAPARMRWVKPRSADAFLVVDATKLRQGGWSLTTAAGVPLDGWVVPRGGLKGTDPSGAAFSPANSFDFLARLDGNRDGRLDRNDPVWAAAAFFRDGDADGVIGAGELTPAEQAVRSLDVAARGEASTDALGTQHVPGVGHLPNGTAIRTVYVRPALVD